MAKFKIVKLQDYFYLLVFSLIIFCIGFFRNVKGGDYLYIVKPSDNNFYSEVSQFVSITGQENIYNAHNLISEEYLGTTPYHYFEIWLGAGISSISGFNNLLIFYFIIFPFFYFLVYLVFLILISNYYKGDNKYFLSFLFMFLTGFILEVYSFFLNTNILQAFCTNVFIRDKLSIIYILIGLFIIQLYSGSRLMICLFTLLLIPIASFTALPSIYGGFFLFGLTYKIHKFLDANEVRRLFIYVTILSICFLFFYLFFGNDLIPGNNSFYINLLEENLRPEYLIRRLLPILKIPIGVLVGYFPYFILISILIFALYKKKRSFVISQKLKIIIFIFVLTSASGVLGWSLLYYTPDSFQLSENFSGPFFAILFNLLLAYLFSETRFKILKVVIGSVFLFLIGLNVIYTYNLIPLSKHNLILTFNNLFNPNFFKQSNYFPSDDYLLSIKELFDHQKVNNLIGVSLSDSSEFKTLDHKSIIVNRSGYYLRYFKNDIGVVSISDFDIPISKTTPFEIGVEAFLPEIEKNLIASSSFYRFVQTQIKNKNFSSIPQSQIDFILKYKVEYMIVSPRAKIPSELASLISKEITDNITGQRFVLLKQER